MVYSLPTADNPAALSVGWGDMDMNVKVVWGLGFGPARDLVRHKDHWSRFAGRGRRGPPLLQMRMDSVRGRCAAHLLGGHRLTTEDMEADDWWVSDVSRPAR